MEDLISSISKKYILSLRYLENGKKNVEKEIEKYKNNIKEIDKLIKSLPFDLKEKYNHIEKVKNMSDKEFEKALFKNIKEKDLL